MCVCMYTHTHKGVYLKYTLELNGTWSAAALRLRRLRLHPEIFPLHFLRILQTCPEGNFGIRWNNVAISVYGTLKKMRMSEIA